MSYDPYQHFERITYLFDLHRFDQAEKELRELLKQQPDFALGHAYLARCFDESGTAEKSRKVVKEMLHEAETGVSLDPENDYCLYIFAHCLCSATKYRRALKVIDKAIEIDPEDAWYHYQKGYILYRMDRLKQARVFFLQALELNPEHYDSLRLLAWVESQIGNKELAIQYADQALQINPEDSHVHTSKGMAMLGIRPPEEVLPVFLEAVRINPNNEQARHALGRIHTDVWFLPRFWIYFKMLFRRIPTWIRFLIMPITILSAVLMCFFDIDNKNEENIVVFFASIFLSGAFLSFCILLTDSRALVVPYSREGEKNPFRLYDLFVLIALPLLLFLWIISIVSTYNKDDGWALNYFFFGTPIFFFSSLSALVLESKSERFFSGVVFVLFLILVFSCSMFDGVNGVGYVFGPMLLIYILIANRFSKKEGRKRLFSKL